MKGMTVSQNTNDRLTTSWQGFQAAIDGIPDDRMTELGAVGDWSVKDVLGHVAFWESRAVARMEREERGEPHPDGGGDYEPINQEQHRLRAGQSLAEARDELEQTHAQLVGLIGRMPTFDIETIAGNTWEHYDDHAEDIRRWREREGI